jgi:Tfp pilus assembly protein PilP
MKLTTGVVALAILTGSAWGQNPGIIQKTKDALFGANKQQTAASNAALQGTAQQGTAQPKPSGAVAGKPAATPAPQAVPAVKPVAAKVVPAAPTAPPAAAKTAQPTVKPATVKPVQAAAKPAPPAAKPVVVPAKTQPAPKAPVVVKQAAAPKASAPAPKVSPMAPKVAAKPAPAAPAKAAKDEGEPKAEKQEDKKYSMTGKRDPFVSPVVNRTMGSGCSTGKKCLDIEQIALHGVVKSDNGMIAVVTNGLNKAYFLRENDPVFNGYVVKITGDSIVFKQNFQDRLGKPFTKDVVKRITTPAV